MPYQTDERLKSFLDTNQLAREQMCRAILSFDKRFTNVRPMHPRGGKDGGKDIEAIYANEYIAYGAVGFINQANDSQNQKRIINKKFSNDLNSAIAKDINAFIFFTNINFTLGEKNTLISKAKKAGINFCEIWDREMLRIVLDCPDGFSIRFQYLQIPLSEAEQATFFAKWGDDIQSVISTGFQRIENTLNRILFFQESYNDLSHLTVLFELNRRYSAEEIGHFRVFCSMHLREPKHNIESILFGISDKSNRIRDGVNYDTSSQTPGIKYGISGGQWEAYREAENDNDTYLIKDSIEENFYSEYKCLSTISSIGRDSAEFISVIYHKNDFIKLFSCPTLKDLDEAFFLLFVNESFSKKIKSIHVHSNGYKLKEINKMQMHAEGEPRQTDFPVVFSKEELLDPWMTIRPENETLFFLRFFDETPKRLFIPSVVEDSLANRLG